MGNELALDVNVICLLILSLFFVSLVTALAGPVVAGVSCVGLWLFGLTKGRAEMRRAQAEALEAEAAAAVAEAGSSSGSGRSRGSDSSGPATPYSEKPVRDPLGASAGKFARL